MNTHLKMKITREKVIATTIVTLLATGFITYQYMYNSKNDLKEFLGLEKQKTDGIIKENEAITGSMAGLNSKILALKSSTSQLEKALAEANAKLKEKEKAINKMHAENKEAKAYLKEKKQLLDEKAKLTARLEDQNRLVSSMEENNRSLTVENGELRNQKSNLQDNMNLLSSLAANNYLTEANKGKKEKLTVRSAQTDVIKVGFDVPENMIKELSFEVVTPDKKKYSSTNNKALFLIKTSTSNTDLVASNISFGPDLKNSKRLVVQFNPGDKPEPGVYRMDIYRKDKYLGSSQIKLR